MYYYFLAAFCFSLSALSLSETVEQALKQSPNWQQQTYQYEGQVLNAHIARGALFPSVSTTLQQSSGTYFNARDNTGAPIAHSSFNQSQINLQLNVPIYRPAAYAFYEASTHQAQADKFSYQMQEERFITDVLSRYFSVLLQAKNVTLSERFLERRKQLYEDTKDKYEVGLVALSDLKAAEAFRDQAVARRIQAKFLLTTAQEQLRNILGDVPDNLYDASLNVNFKYPEHFIAQKPHYSLQVVDELTQKATHEVVASKASLYPELSASSTYSKQPFTQTNGRHSVSQINAGVTLSWTPIQSAIFPAIEKARYSEQAAKSAQLQAARDYATGTFLAQQRLKTSIAQLAAERESLDSNKIYLATVEASYDAGQATITDVLHAQEGITEQEMRVYQEIYDCLMEYFSLGLLLSYSSQELLNTLDLMLEQRWDWEKAVL